MKEKSFTYRKDKDTRIDVRFKVDKGKIVFFCINLSLIKGDKIYDVYRVDTAHGYLHEQKFWRSSKPKKLGGDYNAVFKEKKGEVIKNYKKYIKYYKERMVGSVKHL